MWEYIPERVKMEAEYILQTGATVRTCAARFGVSKSTVHKDVTERLRDIDKSLYDGVRKILDKNLSERHIRGGIATKNKYLLTENNQIKNHCNLKSRHCSAGCSIVNSAAPCNKNPECTEDISFSYQECGCTMQCDFCVKHGHMRR